MKKVFAATMLAASLCLIAGTTAQEPKSAHHHDATENLGSVNFPVSCAPAAQDTFARGVALLHSFEYEEARQAFEKVVQQDPSCAMAYWGQAMSLYHPLWDRPQKATLRRGADLLAKARKLKATPRERDYIAALTVFYNHAGKIDHDKRALDYSKAMQRVQERNPQDREASVFYALSLLGSDSGDADHANARSAVAILNKLFDEQPTHPGIAHYIIHSCDNPQMASLALPAARKYASIAPASSHAVHMPSHIFARLGLWQDDIQSNLRAIQVADQMAEMRLHVMHHKMHSMDFLEYAYLQIGDDASAKSQIDAILAIRRSDVDSEFQDYYDERQAQFQTVYAIERRQWQEALHLQPNPEAVPFAHAEIFWARGVAAGHLHDAAAAKDALNRFDQSVQAIRKGPKPYTADYLKNTRGELEAWTKYAAGQPDDALKQLRSVADEQDKYGKGETDLPAREMLADMLLDMKRPQDALAEYETALRTDPNRFNGLYGAAQAAALSQQKEKAATYYAQLLKNCDASHSDRPELAQAKTLLASN